MNPNKEYMIEELGLEDEVDITEVDINENYYDPVRKTIVIDYRLRKYPELRREVIKHEVQHYRHHISDNNLLVRTWHDFMHDLKRDWKHYNSVETVWKQSREYEADVIEEITERKIEIFFTIVSNLFRSIAAIVPLIIGLLRQVKQIDREKYLSVKYFGR